MQHQFLLVLFLAIAPYWSESASIIDWVWGKKPEESNVLVADGVPLVSIPYETMTEDEKFLQEAAKFTEIQVSSPLDTCQHKVVMKIKTSCSDMTEEDIAKLSVNLLNCQSAVEGRKMFPCTEEMSLRQCTTDMDADMWNAYHLMSNRARAVCYAARNTQFRALTELTVNKLMHTAHSQIKAMGSLKESQERLEEQTLDALKSVSEGNKNLLQQQESIKEAQASAHSIVSRNLRELTNEKALIRAGHVQLAAMTEDIRTKLEKASQDLIEQSSERSEHHKEVLADLEKIQQQAELIESSTNQIIFQNMEASEQYEQTLKQLRQINDTVHFLLELTDTMKAEVDHKLGWLTDYIGDTGEQLERAYRTVLHIIYLILAMVVAAFLHTPFLTRATILGLLPLNLVSYLKQGAEASLDFLSITVLIFLITGMHYLMVGIQYILRPKDKTVTAANTPFTPARNMGNISTPNGHDNKFQTKVAATTEPSIISKSVKKVSEIWGALLRQANLCSNKIWSCVSTMTSSRRSVSPTTREEMSCSYVPSRKLHEDLITDYVGDYVNLTKDLTPSRNFNDSSLLSERDDKFDDNEDLVDANELRRRLGRNGSITRSHYNYPPSPSRSATPSAFASPKNPCIALTRTGKRCRLNASSGQNFCHHHSNGSSFIGD